MGAFRDYVAVMVFLWDVICLKLVDYQNTEWWLDEVVIFTVCIAFMYNFLVCYASYLYLVRQGLLGL